MKAMAFTRYGHPESIEERTFPKPVPKETEVLVRVHASSINSWDWEFLEGSPLVNRLMFGFLHPKAGKQILGADIAGTVEAVGDEVTRLKPGDEVFGDLWSEWGGFAEYACTAETSLELKPANASFVEAASVPQAGVLALQSLELGDPIEAGQKVLINGAGGGVGTFAVQLAKRRGAEVTGVDAAHKLEIVSSIGADYVIDFTEQDFTDAADSSNQYDLIVDCQGTRSMRDIRRVLAPAGTYAMVGGRMRVILQLYFSRLLKSFTRRDSRNFRLVMAGPNKGLNQLKKLIETKELIPVIDKTYPVADLYEAFQYFGEGLHKGKIAISVKE